MAEPERSEGGQGARGERSEGGQRARGECRGPALDLAGPAAPPRLNGELVFETPWESRLFGVTLALCRAGRFEWEEFRLSLIAAIGAWERAGHPPETWSYYRCWQSALERVLASKGLCSPLELDARVHALAARAPGHDHRHG